MSDDSGNRDDDSKGYSRRDFLRTSGPALGAAALGIVGASSGDAQAVTQAGGDDITWNEETDVAVVGSGTGLACALKAAVDGRDVIVLEKADLPGGNTGISGGVAWVPNNPVMEKKGIGDSKKKAKRYVEKASYGQSTESIIDAFLEEGPPMISFVEKNSGVTWEIYEGGISAEEPWSDYHPDWEGAVRVGRSLHPSSGGHLRGSALIDGLVDGVENAGATIRYETPAERLITRQRDDGRLEVLGVKARDERGDRIRIRARSGVLLAAGGFEWDFEMKRRFLRGPTPYAAGVPTNTGDGIRIAEAVGADLTNMNECWGMPVYKVQAEEANRNGNPSPLHALAETSQPGSIMVNEYGERFCNEASDYDTMWRSFFAWENWGETGYRNLPAFAIFDKSVRQSFTIGGAAPDKSLPSFVTRASSLSELADELGIDADGLQAAVNEFNNHVKKKPPKDPQFHRGENPFERAWASGGTGPEATLGPVDEPPFFGAEVAPSDVGTCGGPRVNENAQVLTPFGQPIPGLYAAGNCSGVGAPGAGYGGAGASIGAGLTFAYIAAKHMGESDEG